MSFRLNFGALITFAAGEEINPTKKGTSTTVVTYGQDSAERKDCSAHHTKETPRKTQLVIFS